MESSRSTSFHAPEARIAALELELVELRRQRNAFLPICALPVETLGEVFSWFNNSSHCGYWRCIPWSHMLVARRAFSEIHSLSFTQCTRYAVSPAMVIRRH
jgi:hypothetical protein